MKHSDAVWRRMLQDEQRRADGKAPDFVAVWQAVEAKSRPARKFAVAMTVAFVAVAAAGLLNPRLNSRAEPTYLDVDELLGTTNWSAPSDSLLPEHQFDIYQEIPRLIESTELLDGALL